MTARMALEAREDLGLPSRLAISAMAGSEGSWLRTDDIDEWLAAQARAHRFQVQRIPIGEMDNWSFDQSTGNLVHGSGKFFTIEGMHVTVGDSAASPSPDWRQPVIVQPEIGILGILAKEFDGVLHFLLQAKMEPGNPNLIQLSPTVQATRSNYTKVHHGSSVLYLDYFRDPEQGRVLADALQSEHGSWSLSKANRNMVIEVQEDVQAHEGFCWLTLGQIGVLLRRDCIINMDARSVLACLPAAIGGDRVSALHSDTELLSWLTAERSRQQFNARRIPLADVPDWVRGEWSIRHVQGRHFRVVGVSVQADTREVGQWSQPLLQPAGRGLSAFITRRFDGVPHVLAHARVEGGLRTAAELGPTVQLTQGDLAGVGHPRLVALVRGACQERIRYTAAHSEEGGRFLDAQSDYLIVEADEAEAPEQPSSAYRWVTPDQLSSLSRHSHYVNVQARTLLAAINARAVVL